jgi:hypothetical protein
MKIIILIFLVFLLLGIVLDVWDGHYSINKQKAITAEAQYQVMETKYYVLQIEFAEVWRDKNKWAREVARLKKKHGER